MDNSIYTGITTDIERRMQEHFSKDKKCAKYTSRHTAKKLECVWRTENRVLASKLEYHIKTAPSDEGAVLICIMTFQIRANIGKCFLFSLLCQHGEQLLQKGGCLGVDHPHRLCMRKIRQRIPIRIFCSFVYFAGGDPVAKHFYYIAQWHLYREHLSFYRMIVCPKFKMMPVASLVMQPRC